MMKLLYRNDPPPITALANKGQNLQVPSRLLSRGYTVVPSTKTAVFSTLSFLEKKKSFSSYLFKTAAL